MKRGTGRPKQQFVMYRDGGDKFFNIASSDYLKFTHYNTTRSTWICHITTEKKIKNLSHTENLILDKLFCWGVCPLLLKATGDNQDSLVLRKKRKQFMAFIKLSFLKYCFNIFYLTWRNISWNNENCHSISRAVLIVWYSLCQFGKKNLWGSRNDQSLCESTA